MAAQLSTILRQFFNRVLNELYAKNEPRVRRHLAKVYLLVSSAVACVMFTAMVQIWCEFHFDPGALAVTFQITRGRRRRSSFCLPLLMSFVFQFDKSLFPVLRLAAASNFSVVFSVFITSVVTFIFLTLSALLSRRRQYLTMVKVMVIITGTMVLLRLANFFIELPFVKYLELYAFVYMAAADVVCLTQLIVDQRRAGSRDVLHHALILTIDALILFKYLLLIKTIQFLKI